MMATAPRRQTLPAGEPDAEHRRHVVSALVVDRPGTLNRVSGLLRARSFNIESLTVGTTHEPGKSRMTIAIRGDDGHLRHPTFRGLRSDKPALEVVLERAKRASR